MLDAMEHDDEVTRARPDRVTSGRGAGEHARGRKARRTRVLVVEPNARAQGWEAGWLDDAGFEVMTCPGPSAPGYRCIASTAGSCTLAESADAIVLDMFLASDLVGAGTPAWELLLFYRRLGVPVVAVVGDEDPFTPIGDDGVVVLRRPAERHQLIEAIRRLTGERPAERPAPRPSESTSR